MGVLLSTYSRYGLVLTSSHRRNMSGSTEPARQSLGYRLFSGLEDLAKMKLRELRYFIGPKIAILTRINLLPMGFEMGSNYSCCF